LGDCIVQSPFLLFACKNVVWQCRGGFYIRQHDKRNIHQDHRTILIERADMESAPTLMPFGKHIRQGSYYDHIARNEQEYREMWEYMDTNQLKWQEDELYEI